MELLCKPIVTLSRWISSTGSDNIYTIDTIAESELTTATATDTEKETRRETQSIQIE